MPTNGNPTTNQSRRKVLQTIGAGSATGLLAGCLGDSGGDEHVGTVELFTSQLPFLEEQIMSMLEDFEEEYADQYGVEETEWTDRGPEVETIVSYLETRIRNDDAPEVVETYNGIYKTYNRQEGFFADHEQFDRFDEVSERFFDCVVEDLRFDGELRGLPHYLTFPVIYSNNELFGESDLEPPSIGNRRTFGEVLDMAETLYENTSAEFGFMFRQAGTEIYDLLYSEGINLLNEDQTEAALNTDRTVELMTRLQNLTEQGVIPDIAWTAFSEEPAQQFGAGTVGMHVQVVSSIRQIENYGSDWVTGETLTVGPMPENENYGSHLGRNPIGVVDLDKPDREQQAAFDLCDIATRQEYMESFLRQTTVLVPHEAAVEAVRTDEEFLDQNPNLAEAYELFDSITGDTRTEIYHESITEIYDTFLATLSEIGLGSVDPQEGIDQIEQDINEILQG
jgi:putative chitobiose transport system substrate-binding protein